MRPLTSRERVLAAIQHEETDRVPVDLWITRSSERRLAQHLGCAPGEELREALDIDLRTLFPPYIGPPLEKTDTREADVWGVVRSQVTAGRATYMEVSHTPLAHAASVDDLDDFAWPRADWFDVEAFSAQIERDRGRHAIVVCDERTNRTTVLHQAIYLLGMEKMMMDLAVNEEFMAELFRRIADFYLAVNERIFEACKGQVDLLLIGDDLGTQSGLLISPDMIRRFILPHLARYADQCHAYGIKVLFHSCGSVRDMIGDLIDVGVDVLNPIQRHAAGMIPSEIKEEFGDRLAFHGGADIQHTLPEGSPDDVRTEVRDLIDTMGKGGGYILSSTHNIQDDVPIDNVLAMYREAGAIP